ncbi:glycosyltransferase family 4 protein [Vitiosangium sp. GDMCC 1.1324]|uniref:glycosyltransferase family 4 protein n=1 Tax=Vitiosangium sp. (strain GDMCC 1.1324) TaxID=2138576 RepID=UPI000D3C83FE|nr:glycosyltransferase family 4 protein [Vitiosangium sp. GDMCC 1.1324]PTL75812.1 glycosyl transferase family 1 [Vitiosangium sp. GDMCC 1.1324]
MPLVVHPHFHRRRTGVTAHTELIVPELARLMETRALGQHLAADVPRIPWGELWRRIRQEPVVWHAHRNNELLFGFLLRMLGRQVRLVYTRHGPYPPSWFTRFIARYAEQLVTLNPQGAEWMGMPSRIVTHGVDLERFVPPADRAAAWSAMGLGGRYGVGVVGRVRPNKGQGDFVEAIRPLLSEFPEWKSVVVGLAKGKDAAWAEGLRKSTGGELVLAGEHKNVVPWYQGMSILVHPSYGEAFSMVLVEAMACGCCPVVTRLPHVPAVIEHGRTGFMYEPGDVATLRELLRMLFREPEKARQVGLNAAEEARKRFGVAHEARALAGVYQAALQAQAGAASSS